jgi:hypothetical protein
MKHYSLRLCTVTLAALFAAAPGFSAQEGKDRAAQPGARSEDRITHEVRHELVMLPYYGVFDNKDLANIRASGVSGVLSVVNNLRVEK